MGDQEHSKADGYHSADGDQHHGTLAAGGGKLDALVVCDGHVLYIIELGFDCYVAFLIL